MKLLRLKTTDPYVNLAIEEYLFDKFTDDFFIIWQNEPTVVIGKNQNVYAEIDHTYLKSNNIKVARRITGGGAVYHDLGNVNYSFIGSNSEEGINFERFTAPIISLLSKMGLSAELSGRNDILIDEKKISGNAQCNRKGRVLHHGTLLFNSDLSVLSRVLQVDPEKLRSKALNSTRSRVTNIKELLSFDMSTEEFMDSLEELAINELSAERITPPVLDEISGLADRNSSYDWIYPEKEFLNSYDIVLKKRFDFGSISLSFAMLGEVINKLLITGDFFEIEEVENIENAFVGKKLSELINVAKGIQIEKYINRMTTDDLIAMLSEI